MMMKYCSTLCIMLLLILVFFFLMIRRPPRSTLSSSSAASDVYKRQTQIRCEAGLRKLLSILESVQAVLCEVVVEVGGAVLSELFSLLDHVATANYTNGDLLAECRESLEHPWLHSEAGFGERAVHVKEHDYFLLCCHVCDCRISRTLR
eukprot:TRINITY_DN13305_c0_g1_i3.p1 TRINITY_DN13305_c0_g1~~TRINITY_DN13305_c0_g1_i3.p1  ORF type:complete len:149 (+),score=15.92 TRINITY_DN13305_c0_g1_i3:3-449(+)